MTTLKMTDFVSVALQNKRIKRADGSMGNEVVFSNKYLTDFFEKHEKHRVDEEIIKILILARKFRLTMQFMEKFKVQFQIDFFCFAIESDSFDIAFMFIKQFETQIKQHYVKALNKLVDSYQKSGRFLKAKLHMTKMLFELFNFNQAKIFLEILF